ncbi:MAG: cytochrome d ubiquinol oxidase subunit II [Corynebacteriales bacterium]|nr:cytochrome d ubiquinol oxidase subunit II [Mycobacteriales bacterium]
MTTAELVLVIIGAGATAYALFGGADFGGGTWHLLIRGPRKHRARATIEHAMGPVWEANHVWLIFVLIGLFSAFPTAYGALSRALTVPIGLALIGIVLRGAAFVFAHNAYPVKDGVHHSPTGALWHRAFAISSALTPAMLGLSLGALATGKLSSSSDIWAPFTFPLAWWGAALTTAVAIMLAAVFVCADAKRQYGSDDPLVEDCRRRALISAIATGALALTGVPVLRDQAPNLADALFDRSPLLIGLSVAAGLATIALLWARQYTWARLSAGLASAAVLWGWGWAQLPHFGIDGLTVESAAAPSATLTVIALILIAGFAVIIPALVVMFRVFQREPDRSL